MACGCQAAQAGKVFVFTSADQSVTKEYRTEVEAKAAIIRNGGGTYVAK